MRNNVVRETGHTEDAIQKIAPLISIRSLIDYHPSELHVMNRIRNIERRTSQLAKLWHLYLRYIYIVILFHYTYYILFTLYILYIYYISL